VRPLILAAAAWLLLRLFRIRHPASQHTVWTAVAGGLLLLPLLSAFAPHWKLPVLPAKPISVVQLFTPLSPDVSPLSTRLSTMIPKSAAVRATPSLNINTLLLWVYLAGLLTRLVYRATGWAMLHRIIATSKRVHGRVRESCDVIAPVTAGILRPVVILPAGWRNWSSITRRAVLAHEFAHVRRGDGLAALLARWITCVFWHHPIAWLVARSISETAESACDAVALEGVPDPAGYSRILLAFAEEVHLANCRVKLPGLAMAAPSGIGRRIDQVFELSSGDLRRLHRPGAVVAVLGTPLLCLAATTGLGEHTVSIPPLPRIPSAPHFSQKPSPRPVPTQIAQAQAPPPRANPLPSLTDALAGQIAAAPGLYLDQDLEEYHRRQAYADDHFSYSRMRGAFSARGQAYVRFGPADSIEEYPATADAPAYQLWRYSRIDGLGDDVMLEFVDAAATGEYREAVGPGLPGAYAVSSELGLTTIHVLLVPGVGPFYLSAAISNALGASITNFEDQPAGGPFLKTIALAPGTYSLTLEIKDQSTGIASESKQGFQVR
jgi:beta-lactamase regulating signal transducer with metallopeptidase domain